MRYLYSILILTALIAGCAPAYTVPDLSTPSPGPSTTFLPDEINSISLVTYDGSPSGENENVLVEPIKIGNTVVRSMTARSTGAFKWTGAIPDNSRFTCMVGVGDAPIHLFNVFGIIPPLTRYGDPDAAPSFDIIFRLHINGLEILEETVLEAEQDSWIPINIDLSNYAGDEVSLVFSANGVILGTKLAWWGNPQIVPANESPRRVILFGLDTVAAGHLGWHGYNRDTSPYLDNLTDTSMVFTNAQSPSSWTLPAFASVLSGRNPSLTGADRRNRGLSHHEDMLAEIFHRNGFATAGFVNIPHLQEAGFFQGNNHQWEVHDHPADEALDQAKAWIEQHDNQDFFIFIHLFDPHIPYIPPAEFADEFRTPGYAGEHADSWDLPGRIITENHYDPIVWENINEDDKKQCLNLYDAEIRGLDNYIGQFLDWYKSAGMFDESTIVMFADHGEEFGEHGKWEHGHSMYKEQIHVPLMIKLPKQTHRTVYGGLVGTIDIYPTFLELFGLSSETEPSGQSLVDYINRIIPDPDRLIVSESTLWGPEMKSVTGSQYKFILNMETGEQELFDIIIDPSETNNIIEDQPEITERLGGYLEEYINSTQSGWHLRLLAGPEFPMTIDLSVSSESPIINPEIVTQFFNGSGDGLTIIDDYTLELDLEMAIGDSLELRFTTGDSSGLVTFDGVINDTGGDDESGTAGSAGSALRVIHLGSSMLALPDLYMKLASEGVEVPGILSGSSLSLAVEDPVIAFSFPEYTINNFRGAYLWTIPEGLRAHESSLTAEQEAALESVGYFFN